MELGAAKPAEPRTVSLLELGWSLLASVWSLPAILVLTFAVYAPTLNHYFIADDFWLMRSAQETGFGTFVVEAFDFRDLDPVPQFGFYRPLYVTAFKLCFEAFGMNAVAYHALSVALHLAAVSLVWFIARRLISQPALASVLTLLFAFHPMYTETVVWVARANTLMMTVAYLSSFLLFMKYLDGGGRARFYYAGSLLVYSAAIMIHPNALTLALALPAYVFLVARRPAEALRPRAWLWFVPFLAVSAVWFGIEDWTRREYEYGDVAFRLGWHMYGSFGQYFSYSLLPVLSGVWQKTGLPKGDLFLGLQMIASLAMIGLILLVLARRRWPYLGVFAVWWYIAALVFNTTFILRAPPPQLYMPGASLALLLVVAWLWGRELVEEVAPRALDVGAKVAPLMLVALFALLIPLVIAHQEIVRDDGDDNRRFVQQLDQAIPSIEPGSTVYVIGVPSNLRIFNADAMDAAVELTLGEVDAVAIRPRERAETEAMMGPNDRIFEFKP